MSFLGWIVIGGLAGWIASIITRNNARMGAFANIIVGVIGGFVGGFIVNLVGGIGITGFNFWSLIVAVIGSVILLWLVTLGGKKRRT